MSSEDRFNCSNITNERFHGILLSCSDHRGGGGGGAEGRRGGGGGGGGGAGGGRGRGGGGVHRINYIGNQMVLPMLRWFLSD